MIPFFLRLKVSLVIWSVLIGQGECCVFLMSLASKIIIVACLVGSVTVFLFCCLTFLMCFFAALRRASLIFP